jgi:pimeloyl-ACP methyl ester carboxylesterase
VSAAQAGGREGDPSSGFAEILVDELRIESEPGVVLAATLHLPPGRGGAPCPVMLVVAGSGQVGRQNFEVLKGRLLRDGIAMLEYDKRGGWRSTGEHDDDVAVQVHDVTALVDFLRIRPDIDSDRIVVLGMCHGAIVASTLVAREPGIFAMVMLSGPAGGSTQFLQQLKVTLTESGLDEATMVRLATGTGKLLEARSEGASAARIEALRNELVQAFAAAWNSLDDAENAVDWLDSAESLSVWTQGADRVLGQVRVPVLAVYASVDFITPAAINVPVVTAALAGNPDATIVELPGLNHIFQHHIDLSPGELEEPRMPNSAPEMVDLVGDWLAQRLNPRFSALATRAADPTVVDGNDSSIAPVRP